MLLRSLVTALRSLLVLSVLTGMIYPVLVTAIARIGFADRAAGSLVERDGKIVGSELIGQAFASPRYFWGRPSATSPAPYNAAQSSGSNVGPLSPSLLADLERRIAELHASDPGQISAIPIDLVTASGSGLDPHISPASAEWQVPRIARERGFDVARVRELVGAHTEQRTLGVLGRARVNVLKLNLALDRER